MPSIEERIQTLVDENFSVEGRSQGQPMALDVSIADAGVSSSEVVAFWKLVCGEFGIEISADQFAELLTPSDLISYLEARAA